MLKPPIIFKNRKRQRKKKGGNREKNNKIKKINQNDLNANYKWVKTDGFLRR